MVYLLLPRDVITLGPEREEVGGVEVDPLLLVEDVKVEPHLGLLVPQDGINGGSQGPGQVVQ